MTTWDNIVSEIDVHTFQLSRKLEVGQTYTASLLGDNLGPVVVQLGEEVAVGALDENNSLTFTLQEPVESTEISFLLGKNSGEVIRAKLEKGHKATDWTEAPEDVDAQFSEIRQTAEEISLSVEDQGRDLRSEIKLTADEIASMVEDKEKGLSSRITQTSKEISARVSDNEDNISSVSIKADRISSRVSNNEDGLTEVEQTARNLGFRVLDLEDNPVTGINLSKERAKIWGDKIDLEGLVTIWNRDGSSSTQIDGDKITTGTIHGDKIRANSIHGNKITANTVHGNRIRAGTIDAEKIGTGLLVGNTIRTETGAYNHVYMKRQMISFMSARVAKMDIGFTSTGTVNREPFIRMGNGDHNSNDTFLIQKGAGQTDLSYRSNSGMSRLRMNVNGTVDLEAARRFYVNSPLQFSSTEIINTSSMNYPRVRMRQSGNLVFASNRDVVVVRDGIGGTNGSRSLKLPGLKTYVTGLGANVNISSEEHLRKVSSAKKYKKDIEPLGIDYAENFFYNVEPIWYRSRGADNPEHSFYGYLADDIAKIDPRLVQFTSYGEADGLSYDRVPALLHKVMLKQADRIAELENKVGAIFNKLKNS